MRVASLFPVPSLPMGKIFLPNQKTSHRQGGSQEPKHIEDGGSLRMGNVFLPKQCPSKVYSNCTQMNMFLNCVYCKQIVLWICFFPTWSNKQWQNRSTALHDDPTMMPPQAKVWYLCFFNWLYNKLSQRQLKYRTIYLNQCIAIVYPAIWPEEILRLLENHISKKCAFQWGDPIENPWEIIDFMVLNVYNLHRYLCQ